MGVRQGYRQKVILAGTLLLLLIGVVLTTGCNRCKIQKNVSVAYTPITKMAQRYEKVPYQYEEKKIEKECHTVEPEADEESTWEEIIYDKFKLRLGPVEWVDEPLVEGKTNWIRREMIVYNDYNTQKMVYLDKINYYDGEEIKRSKNPMHFLVEAKSSRIMPLMKDVQYDPKFSIGAEFSNQTKVEVPVVEQEGPKEVCEDKVTMVPKTGYKNVSKGTKEVVMGYREMLKVRLDKEC